MIAILRDIRWYLILVLTYISLMVNNAGHLFMSLLAIGVSLGKCLFSPCPFFMWVVCFIDVELLESFAILDIVYMYSVAQLGLTLCKPMGCSLSDPSLHGIVQAGILQWVATSSSGESSRPRDGTHVLYVSWIGWRVLYRCTTREAHPLWIYCLQISSPIQ